VLSPEHIPYIVVSLETYNSAVLSLDYIPYRVVSLDTYRKLRGVGKQTTLVQEALPPADIKSTGSGSWGNSIVTKGLS